MTGLRLVTGVLSVGNHVHCTAQVDYSVDADLLALPGGLLSAEPGVFIAQRAP